MKKKNIHEGSNWRDVRKDLFTSEEIAESDLRVALIEELIKSRKSKNFSQRDIAKMTNIKQPVIARLEKGSTDPRLSTILKILFSAGKTIKIVPLPTHVI
jgi:predicted XRE-type DNA-binding protein